MNSLPRIEEFTREKVSREFDDLGPAACLAEISQDLADNNPELLDLALHCANRFRDPLKIMTGYCIFYRLLLTQSTSALLEFSASHPTKLNLNPLPRVTVDTRTLVIKSIVENGADSFTIAAIDELDRNNPELLRMAHNFALLDDDYLRVMQGFALLYESLRAQSMADRAYLQ
ncbi:MAG: hypothetical protein H7Y02_01430 [Candidatus Obscuribacterales bacterium]|nr:hypothetical protein [Steroidobacteraceae bacterium]